MTAQTPLRNAAVVVPLALINSAGYLLLNQYHLRAPIELPLSPLDRAIPFVAWTMWPYLVLMLLDVVVPLALRDRQVFRETIFAYVVAIALNFVFWTLLPTTYPRPAPPSGDSITEAAFRIMVSVDSPASCFPSGHITIPAVACWGFVREHPKLRLVVWVIFLLFSLTVLTTKQHYVADILGGLGTALVGVIAAQRWAARQPDAAVG